MNRSVTISREAAERAADVLTRLAIRFPLDSDLREEATVAGRVLRMQLAEGETVSTTEETLRIELGVFQSLVASALMHLERREIEPALLSLRSLARRPRPGS